MATQEDVRGIALSLPETSEAEGHLAFSVLNEGKQKGFVWDRHRRAGELITNAWRYQAPREPREAFDRGQGLGAMSLILG